MNVSAFPFSPTAMCYQGLYLADAGIGHGESPGNSSVCASALASLPGYLELNIVNPSLGKGTRICLDKCFACS